MRENCEKFNLAAIVDKNCLGNLFVTIEPFILTPKSKFIMTQKEKNRVKSKRLNKNYTPKKTNNWQ